jgi:signal transduction histidine kinase
VPPPSARLQLAPWQADLIVAVGLSALSLLVVGAGAQDIGSVAPVSVGLLLLQTLPLAFRHLAVWPVFLVSTAATIAHAALATDSLNSSLGSLFALYAVADQADRRRSAVAGLILGIGLGAIIVTKAPMPAALGALLQAELAVTVAWILGTWAHERRAYIGTVEDRAARAEREQQDNAARAVASERARIARELHDVVSHQVSVIVIQAGAARRALGRRPDDVAAAIEAIETAGRHALTDMRRMLGILGEPGPGRPESLAPLPGLDELGALVERVRAAGIRVELSIEGERRPLDPGVEVGAYRIVQEALTNVLKHASASEARVAVGYEPAVLMIEVENRRTGRSSDLPRGSGEGHGLIGMRERATVLGGTLDAGPTPTGFRVSARLPVQAQGERAP